MESHHPQHVHQAQQVCVCVGGGGGAGEECKSHHPQHKHSVCGGGGDKSCVGWGGGGGIKATIACTTGHGDGRGVQEPPSSA